MPSFLIDPTIPVDDGFGLPGDPLNETFNTSVLVEAADTPPFFHNNSVSTIEAAVAFFDSPAFNGNAIANLIGGIQLDATEVAEIAAFLRALNALENIRSSLALNTKAMRVKHQRGTEALDQSVAETEDAIEVLTGGVLHLYGEAIELRQKAMELERNAIKKKDAGVRQRLLNRANQLLTRARDMIAIMT